MHDIKRNIEEILSIYLLEEDFIDIYVEGPTDRVIIENFLDYKKKETKVIEIDSLDFSIYFDASEGLDLRSNKNKLLFLSRLLLRNQIKPQISCLVDRDFDGLLHDFEQNSHLLYTDYSCMESYICTTQSIKKILDVGFRKFPFDSQKVLTEITKIVRFLFLIRLVNCKLNLNATLPKVENNFKVNNKTGDCEFNCDKFLEIFISINKIIPKAQQIKNFIDELKDKFNDDFRYYMNGHDFIFVLFHYINKVKNSVNFKIDTFERAVYMSIQPNHLDDYHLFQKIS